MKLTLTPQEHRRVDRVMGAGVTDSRGRRLCRCGTLVRHTPNELWQHTLECEKRQQHDARTAQSEQQRVNELLLAAGER